MGVMIHHVRSESLATGTRSLSIGLQNDGRGLIPRSKVIGEDLQKVSVKNASKGLRHVPRVPSI